MSNPSGPHASDDTLRRVARARDRFMEDREPGASAVREHILTSWRRSRTFGVQADRLEPPYSSDIDSDCRLLRAAGPVLDRLEGMLSGTPMSIILTDAKARVIARRNGDRSLNRHLDRIRLAPGFSYAEEHIGTNGIGTALEERRAFHVFGSEHFSGRLQTVSCAGAPIRNRLTGRLEGIVDLTCWRVDTTPLMSALAQEAAKDIEQRLLELGSERERLVFGAFIAACRRTTAPVLAVSGDILMSNTAAARLLDPADQLVVREKVAESAGSAAHRTERVVLSGDRPATLRCRRIDHDPRTADAVIVEVDLHEPGPRRTRGAPHPPLPGVAGHSPGWRRACEDAEPPCRQRLPLLLVGEPGVGKLALARAAHHRWHPAATLTVVHGADSRPDPRAWLARTEAAVADPRATVVLRRLDLLDEEAAAPLAGLLDTVRCKADRAWVVGTLTAEAPEAAHCGELVAAFGAVVTVPPLRHRAGDVRDLVPVLLARHARGRAVACSSEALRILLHAPWPGNVAELEETLRSALRNRPSGDIRPQDLPPSCFSDNRRVLTLLEAVERDTITRALVEARGDKKAAAEALGISRATIYRKIRSYGISTAGMGAGDPGE